MVSIDDFLLFFPKPHKLCNGVAIQLLYFHRFPLIAGATFSGEEYTNESNYTGSRVRKPDAAADRYPP